MSKLKRGAKVEVAMDATTWGNRPAQISGMVGRVVKQLSRERVSVRIMVPIVMEEVVMRTDLIEGVE